jgi:hypothetical protein
LRWTRPSLQTRVRSLCRGSARALTHPTFLLVLQQPFRKIRGAGALCAGVKTTESEWFGPARTRRTRQGACHKVTSGGLETCQFVRRLGKDASVAARAVGNSSTCPREPTPGLPVGSRVWCAGRLRPQVRAEATSGGSCRRSDAPRPSLRHFLGSRVRQDAACCADQVF